MVRRTISAGARNCPARDELVAFDRGLLPAQRLEAIAEHLSGCEACETSLRGLSATDVFQARLRLRPPEVPAVDEAACQAIEDRARVIPLEEPVEPTVSDLPSGRAIPGPRLPMEFGSYLLLEQLGQGGMGVVFKARQEVLKRLVALKMVRAGAYAGTEERQRFRREGEAIARVRHGHVVQIHEFGEHDGQLFFSMELLEGGTLANRLSDGLMPPREAAGLVAALARAVQAAHAQGVVHRDLKPGNVLFAADGTARVTDFGLAKLLDAEGSDTISEAILGTPAYMAPEQARGEVRSVGTAADVWALGAILYECLTGRPPFKGETRSQTLELVRSREPEPPSRLRPGLPLDLEAICLKCLEREPADRYPSAEALADELDCWLRGEPTRVRPLGRLGRGRRAMRRRPRTTTAVLLAFLVPLVGLPVWYHFDPRRPVWEMERRLAHGEKVALIGPTGGPRWSRWGVRQGLTNTVRTEDGTFSMTGMDQTVLTLLPDPQRSYRLSAEVRHDSANRRGSVGLAFLHSRHPKPPGEHHCLCALHFNDWNADFRDPKTGALCSRVELTVLSVPRSGLEGDAEYGPDHVGILKQHLFAPAGPNLRARPWRMLAVEVRPDGIDLFWEGEHLGRVPHEKIDKSFQAAKKVLVGNRMVDPLPDVRPAFSPRDALGLFVIGGQGSFRSVAVEPLPEP